MMRKVHDVNIGGYLIFCPACKCAHRFDDRWKFNGDYDNPTFTPSMHSNPPSGKHHTVLKPTCHSFVTDGSIRFLSDCTHDLAGQTVPLDLF